MARRIYDSWEEGGRGRGRPHRRWLDGVVSALGVKGLTLEQAGKIVNDRPVWRRLINGV